MNYRRYARLTTWGTISGLTSAPLLLLTLLTSNPALAAAAVATGIAAAGCFTAAVFV
jgi:hypothetical protein